MQKQYLKGIATKAADGTYRVLASTASIDRQGDSIQQNGWMLDNFLKNPVVLWAHQYDQLPVGKATSIQVTSQGLEMAFEFAPASANEKAGQVQQLFDGGFLNAVSVGFIPAERNGNIITRAELLEVSIVPVPANQEALRLAMSKGLSIDKVIADIEKGEVGDELDAIEAREQKWEKWEEITEVLSAMWTVYFDEATPVEDFSKLLNEAIELLKVVSAQDGIDEDDMDEEAVNEKHVKFLGGIATLLNGRKVDAEKTATVWMEKAGRQISEKNKAIIKAAIDHMNGHMKTMTDAVSQMGDHCAALDQMLQSASSDNGSGKAVKSEARPVSREELVILRTQLRAQDRNNEVALAMVNRFLSSKGKN